METDTQNNDVRRGPPKISAAFTKALAAAQAKMGHAHKDKEVEIDVRKNNTKIKYAYATFAACLDVVRPAWTAEGIAFTFDVDQEVREVDYETDNGSVVKRLGALLRVAIVLYFGDESRPFSPIIFSTPTLDPKAIGSAITYAKRYALTNAAGIAADEDDDGTAAEDRAPSMMRQRQPAARAHAESPPAEQRPRGAPPPAAASPAEEDPTAALSADLAREVAETADLQALIALRTRIRASPSRRKLTLLVKAFERSIGLAQTQPERAGIAQQIQSAQDLTEEAKAHLHKVFRAAASPAAPVEGGAS